MAERKYTDFNKTINNENPLGLVGGVYSDALILSLVVERCQVQNLKNLLPTVQYSNSNLTKLSNSNSTVSVREVFVNLTDLIPDDDYKPFYVSKYNRLGYVRFMELANKARAGKTPQRLFFWMLKNNELVK